MTLAVANVAALRVGWGAVCADTILQRAYNDHTGGNAGGIGITTGGGGGLASLGVVVFKL